jgi:Outer membrane protein beta-barrel domain
MNKVLLILLILLITGSGWQITQAQVSIGMSGGISRFKVGGDTPPDGSYGNLTGVSFGGLLDVRLFPVVVLSFQPSFIQKGTKIAYEVRGQDELVDSVDVRFNYLALPLMVKVSTRNERWYVSSGLEFGYLLDGQLKTSDQEAEIDSLLNDLDLAVNLGVGVLVKKKHPQVFIELRYNQSLTDVVKSNVTLEGASLEPRIKNSGLFLLGGIYF